MDVENSFMDIERSMGHSLNSVCMFRSITRVWIYSDRSFTFSMSLRPSLVSIIFSQCSSNIFDICSSLVFFSKESALCIPYIITKKELKIIMTASVMVIICTRNTGYARQIAITNIDAPRASKNIPENPNPTRGFNPNILSWHTTSSKNIS